MLTVSWSCALGNLAPVGSNQWAPWRHDRCSGRPPCRQPCPFVRAACVVQAPAHPMRLRDAPRLVGWVLLFPLRPQISMQPPGRSPNPHAAAGLVGLPRCRGNARAKSRCRNKQPRGVRVRQNAGRFDGSATRRPSVQATVRRMGGPKWWCWCTENRLGIGMGSALSSAPIRLSVPIPKYYEGLARVAGMHACCPCEPTTAWRANSVFKALPGAGAAIPSARATPTLRSTPPHSALVVVARFGWELGRAPLSGHALRGQTCRPGMGRSAGQWKLAGLFLRLSAKPVACHSHLHLLHT